MMNSPSLPIHAILPELRSALREHRTVVLTAEPGAGKTTGVPPALVNEPWLGGKKIVMLEPRRLAARRAAVYMAGVLGQKPGEFVGYRIRGDSKIGPSTRIEVVTEAILTRILQDDPGIAETGLIIFDEFHERSIHTDTGLAFALDVQATLRPDLRCLLMSATLDGSSLAACLGDAPVLEGKGRQFSVETRYLTKNSDEPAEQQVASVIRRAIKNDPGDVLAFLPGRREIQRVDAILAGSGLPADITLHSLYGEAPYADQERAIAPSAQGYRKIILSTSLAETSLTIDGIGIVVDSGLARISRFDPRRGMAGLVTVPVSRATADQRKGRAGRTRNGICYRLWTEQHHRELPEKPIPEILLSDLTPLALELSLWGTPDGKGLRFPDPPSEVHLKQAQQLLRMLGALDESGMITGHGRRLAGLPVHPRIAHMLVRGRDLGLGSAACDVAAILEETDLFRGSRGSEIDLHSRWYALRHGSAPDRNAQSRAREQAGRLRSLLGVTNAPVKGEGDRLGILLGLCYPERIGKQRAEGSVRYQMAGGTGAILPKNSALHREAFLAIGDADAEGTEVRVFLAEPVKRSELGEIFPEMYGERHELRWDDRREMVAARRVTLFGAIEMSEEEWVPPPDEVTVVMLEGIRRMGIGILPWSKQATSIRERSEWLRKNRIVGTDWPDLSDGKLTTSLGNWLGPYLQNCTKRADLGHLDLTTAIRAMFSHHQLRELERLAPTHLVVPTGSRIPLEYGNTGAPPVLAVRLQEMFGQTTTPAVAGGTVPVLIHLLSPAKRPVAVTQDLVSFWKNTYAEVRKDMRGRYPKHEWPEDPLSAPPTRRVKMRKK